MARSRRAYSRWAAYTRAFALWQAQFCSRCGGVNLRVYRANREECYARETWLGCGVTRLVGTARRHGRRIAGTLPRSPTILPSRPSHCRCRQSEPPNCEIVSTKRCEAWSSAYRPLGRWRSALKGCSIRTNNSCERGNKLLTGPASDSRPSTDYDNREANASREGVPMSSFAVLLPAAGRSTRFNDQEKSPLRRWTVERSGCARRAFINRTDVAECFLIINPDDEERFRMRYAANLAFMNVKLVHGGRERFDSVANGLAKLSPEVKLVAIHDAVRPWRFPGSNRDGFCRRERTWRLLSRPA